MTYCSERAGLKLCMERYISDSQIETVELIGAQHYI
jgi:hypothetical protein